MTTTTLLKEKLIPLQKIPKSLQKHLNGVVRFVNKEGNTYGLFLDKEMMQEFLEELEYKMPEFWNEIQASRKSGIIFSQEIEKRLGI